MIEYERIDISEKIDVDKTNKSKECMLCHYWFFLEILKILLLFILKKNKWRIYFSCMNKQKAKKLIKTVDLIDKTGGINCND